MSKRVQFGVGMGLMFLLAVAGAFASGTKETSATLAGGTAPATATSSALVAQAKAAVAKFAGPQSEWLGPTSGPTAKPGMRVVYLSGDEKNDISHEYGVYMEEAAARIGWHVTVIDGKGIPTGWLSGMDQAIALNPNGIAMFADAASLQVPIAKAVAEGIKLVGLHAAGEAGPQPQLHLFDNIQEDTRAIGRAQADWVIANSNGTARVVIVTHNEYAIAKVKSDATRDELLKCSGCKVLAYVNFPASRAAQHMPQLTTSWVQRFGLPLYVTSVGDNDFDFAVPTLREGGVSPSQVKLVGADGNKSAYERIRSDDDYQAVTVAEPFEEEAWQAIDELNRAFHGDPPSGFIQSPYLVTHENIGRDGGPENLFIPSNHYKEHYLKIWGVKD